MFPKPFPIHSTPRQLLRQISSLEPFQESRCLWKEEFPLAFLHFPPCPWMLTSTSCPATARVQPGELVQLTAWQEKAARRSSISPFKWWHALRLAQAITSTFIHKDQVDEGDVVNSGRWSMGSNSVSGSACGNRREQSSCSSPGTETESFLNYVMKSKRWEEI